MHTPVLLHEVIEGLAVKKDRVYIDATLGEGGHLKEFSSRGARVLALEVSEEQLKRARELFLAENVTYVRANFSDIEEVAKKNGFELVDGILFDLGLSFWELAHLKKGFSFKDDGERLDMRLSGQGSTAAEVLNSENEDALYDIFSKNSEEVNSRAIAQKIVELRKKYKIETVRDLKSVVDLAVGKSENRIYARIFQSLRMHVNSEKENLKKGIEGAVTLLKTGGRIAVISFHSIEDRIVKNLLSRDGLKQIVKKTPSFKNEKFERSATLRIVEKI